MAEGKSKEISGKVGYGNPPEHSRFPKGKTGNPKGYPKGQKNRGTVLRELLETVTTMKDINGQEMKGTAEQKMILALLQKSFSGDVLAIREALDSVYGKVTQPVHQSGTVGINVYYREQPGNEPLEGEDE